MDELETFKLFLPVMVDTRCHLFSNPALESILECDKLRGSQLCWAGISVMVSLVANIGMLHSYSPYTVFRVDIVKVRSKHYANYYSVLDFTVNMTNSARFNRAECQRGEQTGWIWYIPVEPLLAHSSVLARLFKNVHIYDMGWNNLL